MRTIRTKVYQFSELSKAAKEKALENYASDYNASEYLSFGEVIETLKKFSAHFSAEADYTIDLGHLSIGYYESPYSTVKFTMDEEFTKDELKSLIKSMGSYDKKSLKGMGDCVFTGVCFDDDAADGAREAFFSGTTDLNEILTAGFYSLMKAAAEDNVFQLSEEGYADLCDANEYEFKADGTRF